MKNKLQKKPRLGRSDKVLLGLLLLGAAIAIAFISFGGWQLWLRYQATHNPSVAISTEIITHSTDSPDETKPTQACADYRAAEFDPERLSIPSLGVEGCIQNVGIDQFGAVAVPTNIHVAGWYINSVRPGESGVSIIDGHINGNFTNDGIFQHLDQLRPGEVVTITRGNGAVLRYEVTSVQSVALEQAAEALFSKETSIKSQLNLITCGGRWNDKIKQFDHRIIVTSKLVQ